MNKARITEVIEKGIAEIRKTADLPSISSGVEEDMIKLAHEARNVLGYHPLYKKAILGGNTLANVLIELGIEVLSPVAILKYQRLLGRPNPVLVKMVAQGTGVLDEEEEDEVEDEDDGDDDDDEVDEREEEEPTPRSITNYMWARVDIEHYSKPIPPHVLLKAIEIKKALPTANFEVEELVKYDPFLIVSFQNERYYIEVWEEPTFEKRATKNVPTQDRKRKS